MNRISLAGVFSGLPNNLKRIFWATNLLWHVLAIFLTYVIVISGFDWDYYKFFRGSVLQSYLFPAVVLGMFVPLLGPLSLYIFSAARKNFHLANLSLALGQSALLGLLVSWFYKALTGRAHPDRFTSLVTETDITKVFNFGFLRGGVFWGWPSSHTTVAFAMAAALYIMFPKNKILYICAFAYALYVGLGISVSIHWFSEFAAGAIFGSLVGLVVGKAFKHKLNSLFSII
jgi:membrane-associated phospholipid phosphatase